MTTTDLRPGQRVTVWVHSDERRTGPAIVRRVPPFTEDVAGTEHRVTDEVQVEYPNTSIDGGDFFGNMLENVPLDEIEP